MDGMPGREREHGGSTVHFMEAPWGGVFSSLFDELSMMHAANHNL